MKLNEITYNLEKDKITELVAWANKEKLNYPQYNDFFLQFGYDNGIHTLYLYGEKK